MKSPRRLFLFFLNFSVFNALCDICKDVYNGGRKNGLFDDFTTPRGWGRDKERGSLLKRMVSLC